MCLVCPMLPVSLDCPFLIALRFSLTFTCHVSCVSKMLPVSLYCPSLIVHSVFSSIYLLQTVLCLVCPMLSVSLYWPFLIAPSVFSNVYLSCVLYVQCCLCLCIVHSWLPLLFFLTFICHVSCMSNVVCVSVLTILDCPFGFL
jgi:hypothetical protein